MDYKHLKNFFIPHYGNGYKPHILHPKRIFFHTISVLLIKSITFIFAISFPVTAWLTSDFFQEEAKRVIGLTNELRKSQGLAVLRESDLLSSAAASKALDMLNFQYFAHQSPNNLSLHDFLRQSNYYYAYAGENLAKGFTDAQGLVQAWDESPTHRANMLDKNFSEIGVGIVSGEYQSKPVIFTAQLFATPDLSRMNNDKPVDDSLIDNKDSQEASGSDQNLAVTGKKTTINKKNVIEKKNALIPSVRETSSVSSSSLDFPKKIARESAVLSLQTNGVSIADGGLGQVSAQNISPIQRYLNIKKYSSGDIGYLFDITSFYFRALLFVAIFSLAINILVEIKRQHPHIIFSTAGFILLLIALISL